MTTSADGRTTRIIHPLSTLRGWKPARDHPARPRSASNASQAQARSARDFHAATASGRHPRLLSTDIGRHWFMPSALPARRRRRFPIRCSPLSGASPGAQRLHRRVHLVTVLQLPAHLPGRDLPDQDPRDRGGYRVQREPALHVAVRVHHHDLALLAVFSLIWVFIVIDVGVFGPKTSRRTVETIAS